MAPEVGLLVVIICIRFVCMISSFVLYAVNPVPHVSYSWASLNEVGSGAYQGRRRINSPVSGWKRGRLFINVYQKGSCQRVSCLFFFPTPDLILPFMAQV